MVKHWLIRIKDGKNFWNSSKYHIWSADSHKEKKFLKHVKTGDILWFVTGKSSGHIVAVAVYENSVKRVTGPIVALTRTDEELGWDEEGAKYDTEIHYSDLINIVSLNLLSRIQGQTNKRLYDCGTCAVDLPDEYTRIQRYRDIRPVEFGVGMAPPVIAAEENYELL